MFSVDDILLDNCRFSKMDISVLNYSVIDVNEFLKREFKVSESLLTALQKEKVDGRSLLILNERDVYRLEHKYHLLLGDVKRFLLVINKIQQTNRQCLIYLGILDNQNNLITNSLSHNNSSYPPHHQNIFNHEIERISPANSVDGSNNSGQFATCIQPEFFKTTVSLGKKRVISLDSFETSPLSLFQARDTSSDN